MASAFSMLFFTLFADGGPINSLLMQIGFISEPYKFLSHTGSARGLIAFSIFPVIIVYLFLSRYIVQGVAVGSVKG